MSTTLEGQGPASRATLQPRVPFPAEVSDEDLVRHFSLSEAHQRETLSSARGESNRIGYALQLCHVLQYGRFATAFETVPPHVVRHIALQLGLSAPSQFVYPDRERTRREHNEAIQRYLGLRRFRDSDEEPLREYLVSMALADLREPRMVRAAERWLMERKVLLPGESVLREIARSALANAEDALVEKVNARVDAELGRRMSALLAVPSGRRRSGLEDLSRPPGRAVPATLLSLCERIGKLRELGIDHLNLSGIQADVVADFADRVSHYTAPKLARFRAAKRHAFLACHLSETLVVSIDAAVKTFTRLVQRMQNRLRDLLLDESRDFREEARAELRSWVRVGKVLARPENESRTVSDAVWCEMPASEIAASVGRAEDLLTTDQETLIEKSVSRFSSVRRFFPEFLEAAEFIAGPGGEDLVRATEVVREMNREGKRKLPPDAPLTFVSPAWRPFVVTKDGEVVRSAYEVHLFVRLKEAIDHGEVFVKGSRRYVSIASLLYNDDAWVGRREDAYRRLKLPQDPNEYLRALEEHLAKVARQTDEGFPKNPFARIERGVLRTTKEAAEAEDPEVEALHDLIESRMPEVAIERLLHEVDQETDFTAVFRPPIGYEQRTPTESLRQSLLAGTLALGTNLGLWTMAKMAPRLSYAQLAHAAEWYLKELLVAAANAHLVDVHHALPFSSVWGEGKCSSSDGIRFAAGVSMLLAEPNPKYFGWGEGLTSYKAMCDQWSIFSTQLISCHESEALRMLSALLSNRTALPLREGHAADTAGANEPIFALCHLAGYAFWPRLADLPSVRHWKLSRDLKLKHIEPLFEGCVDREAILAEYDNIVRLVASLVDRQAPAHVLGRCLVASSRNNPLARAVTALGRVYRTIYLLQYLDSAELRKTVRRLLHRHESQNALGRALVIGARGEFRVSDYEAAAARAACHSLLENAILYWNTRKMADVVKELREEGCTVRNEHLAEVSPLFYRHINYRGRYEFDMEALARQEDPEESD